MRTVESRRNCRIGRRVCTVCAGSVGVWSVCAGSVGVWSVCGIDCANIAYFQINIGKGSSRNWYEWLMELKKLVGIKVICEINHLQLCEAVCDPLNGHCNIGEMRKISTFNSYKGLLEVRKGQTSKLRYRNKWNKHSRLNRIILHKSNCSSEGRASLVRAYYLEYWCLKRLRLGQSG